MAGLLEHPVILIIIIVPAFVHQILENLPHIVVVGSLLEFEVSTVLQVSVEFFRHATRQRLDGGRDLLIFDSIVLVILVLALKTLPRQRSLQEVDENETDGLEVVTPTLLDAEMCIDTSIARRTRQRLVVLVGNVLTGLGIAIALRKAEVNHVNDVLLLAVADEEVVRLHIAMNKMVVVQELEALDHLICNHKSGLDGEFALAEIEGILKTGSQQVHDHGIVVALDTKPVYARNTCAAVEYFVNLGLVQKLREFRLNRFLHHKVCQLN